MTTRKEIAPAASFAVAALPAATPNVTPAGATHSNAAAAMPSALATPLQVDIPILPPGELERLSVEYAVTRNENLRGQLVLYHQRLVRSIASRFMGVGETIEDLVQVGNIGLINALDRYNPAQGTRFSTYATPTILGEIKRHFRDKTAGIKVPRHLQELSLSVRRMTQRLTQELGRAPVNNEIALKLGVTEEDVEMAQECGEAINLLSLDTHFDSHPALDSASLLDLVGRIDKTLLEFETYGDLRKAMEELGPREREVIWLRFFDELSQAKIAKRLDISQMHVSRLQQRALKRLREMLSDDIRAVGGTPPPPATAATKTKSTTTTTTTRRVRRCDG